MIVEKTYNYHLLYILKFITSAKMCVYGHIDNEVVNR